MIQGKGILLKEIELRGATFTIFSFNSTVNK